MIAVESNPLTSLISMVCVKSWLNGGRLIENPMFRSTVGKFEGVRIYLLNGQQFGVLRRSSQRSGSKSRGKGDTAAMDRCSESEQAVQSVSETSATVDKRALCRSTEAPVLRLEDSTALGAVPTSDDTIRSPAESTTSGNTDAYLL